jgi:hypothetical protein
MDILVLTKKRKHVFQNVLSNVKLSEKPVPCDVCIVTNPPTSEEVKQLGTTPVVYYVETDPLSQDIDRFLYTPTPLFSNYKLILLPEIFQASKSYLETRYPSVPIKIINSVLLQYPNKLFEGERKPTTKLNIFIRASNENFAESSWRQLCIAENMFLKSPEVLNDVYLFNSPTNKCAIEMYENLELFKQKKLRTFIDFEPAQIIQHISLQPQRSVYLMNSVVDVFDPLAFYSLQNQIGVVHTSNFLKQYNLGKHYVSYDIDSATAAIKSYLTETITPPTELCKKLENTQALLDAMKTFTKPEIKLITGKTYSPKDTTIPLVIGNDMNLEKESYFLNSLTKHNWEYAILSSDNKWQAYKEFLDTLPDDKLVVISDIRSVICCRSSKQFMKGFQSKQRGILTSMDVLCHAKFETDVARGQCIPLHKYWQENKRDKTPLRKFVNGGLICGNASFLRKLFTWSLRQTNCSDQMLYANYMNAYPSEVYADDKAEILHSSSYALNGALFSHEYQIQDSPNMAELFGHGAFFLHIPNLEDNGQKTIYKYVKAVLDLGTNSSLLKINNYPDIDFFGNFVDGSALIIR